MNITSVRVQPHNGVPNESGHRVIAYAQIHLENNWRITHIRVVETPEGTHRVEMPSVKSRSGYSDVVHALNERTRQEYREEILKAVRKGNYSPYREAVDE